VELHGGHLAIESKPGSGTRVTAALPESPRSSMRPTAFIPGEDMPANVTPMGTHRPAPIGSDSP
jgi:hypothetical protein